MVISSFLITDMIVISSAILGHRMTIIQEQWNIKSIPKPKTFSKFGHMVKKEAEKHLLRLYREFNTRSEEHTSELQSRDQLVCCLLLEKIKYLILPYKVSYNT